MTYFPDIAIKVSDSYSISAFGALRVEAPTTIFDSKQVANAQTFFWDDQQTSGTATSTYNTNQSSSTLAVNNLTAGTRVRQTRRWFNYQPGKGQRILMTFVLGSGGTGITKRVGYYETNNGFYLEQTSSGVSLVRRTYTSGSVVNNSVAQSSWNLDKMDGTGVSGVTLDWTKTQIMWIDMEWLGVGRVRCGFVVAGKLYYAHEFNHANSLSLVYMTNPNLPVRYEITNDGTGAANSLVCICCSVISEGGQQETGFELGCSRADVPLTTANNANIYPLIAIRLNSSYYHASVKPVDFSFVCTSTAAYNWYLLLNPTVTGTAFSYTNITGSAVDYDVSRTNATTVSGGTLLRTGSGSSTVHVISATQAGLGIIQPGVSIGGTADVLVLAVQRVTGTTETFYGGLNWRESQ